MKKPVLSVATRSTRIKDNKDLKPRIYDFLLTHETDLSFITYLNPELGTLNSEPKTHCSDKIYFQKYSRCALYLSYV